MVGYLCGGERVTIDGYFVELALEIGVTRPCRPTNIILSAEYAVGSPAAARCVERPVYVEFRAASGRLPGHNQMGPLIQGNCARSTDKLITDRCLAHP